MDPITIALLVSAGVAVVGPLIAEAMASGDRKKAEALREEAMKQFNIELPAVEAIAVQPDIVESQAAKSTGNVEAQQARMSALRGLSQRAAEGYNIEDRAAINAALNEISAQERGSREAIMRRLPARSGAQVAAMLSNQQAAAQQASQTGLDIAAQSRRQALQALSQTGNLAGEIDVDAFNQAMARGQAADAIAKFNAANRLQSAQQYEQNRLSQANLANEQRFRQQQAKAGALMGAGDLAAQEAQRTRQGVGGTAQGVSSAAGAYAAQQAYSEDPQVKLRRKKAEEELMKRGATGDF